MDKNAFIRRIRANIYNRILSAGNSINSHAAGYRDETIEDPSDHIYLRCEEIEHLINVLDIVNEYEKEDSVPEREQTTSGCKYKIKKKMMEDES